MRATHSGEKLPIFSYYEDALRLMERGLALYLLRGSLPLIVPVPCLGQGPQGRLEQAGGPGQQGSCRAPWR